MRSSFNTFESVGPHEVTLPRQSALNREEIGSSENVQMPADDILKVVV